MKKTSILFSKDFLINFLMIFYIISIFLDLHFFYSSISTLIRVIFITILFIIAFIKYASKENRKYLLIYFFTYLLYSVLHILNCNNISILSELLYLYKMIMNIFLVYSVYKLEIDKNRFYNVISISSFIISTSIVVLNIFKLGYTSYDYSNITYNLFDWFKSNNLSFLKTSSKGLFHLTNQVVAILILYLPILFNKLKEKTNLFNYINIMFVIISLFMLGTRISTYTVIIYLCLVCITYLIIYIIDKDANKKFILLVFLLFIVSIVLLKYCPLNNRNYFYDSLHTNKETKVINEIYTGSNVIETAGNSSDELKSYLKDSHVDEDFYEEYYPIDEDRAFYENYSKYDKKIMSNTRFLQREIIKRVKYLNDNKLDDYFGIGYNRVINIFNIESDFTMQYYSLGIIGTILVLGIYIGIIIYSYFKILFNLKRYFNFENIMFVISISYFILSSYFTGNILNAISTIIPISFVMGYFLSILNIKDENDYEYYLGLKTTLKSKDEIVDEVFKSKNQVILFNINPLICLNFRNNEKIKEKFNKENYNIPDGNGIVLASKLTSNNIKTSIPGIEIMESICKMSISKKYSIYLYGAKEDSVSKAKKELEKKYKNIKIIGYTNGYEKENVAIKEIISSKPDILFVALGSPKQEEFIIKYTDKLKDVKIIMPVGGSFDVISGNIKRAPKTIRKLKLEWLYRMFKEPKRFKQVFSLFYFLLLVLFVNLWYNEKE